MCYNGFTIKTIKMNLVNSKRFKVMGGVPTKILGRATLTIQELNCPPPLSHGKV